MTGATHTPPPKGFEHVGPSVLKMKGIYKSKTSSEKEIAIEDKR